MSKLDIQMQIKKSSNHTKIGLLELGETRLGKVQSMKKMLKNHLLFAATI